MILLFYSFKLQVLGGASQNESVASPYRICGLLAHFICAVSYSFFLVLQKPILAVYKSLPFLFLATILSCPFNIFVGLFFVSSVDLSLFNSSVILSILYIVIFGTVIPFILYSYAMQHIPTSIAAIAICLSPVFSPLLGYLFLDEALNYMHIIGGLVIISGVVLIVYSRHNVPAEEEIVDYSKVLRIYGIIRNPCCVKAESEYFDSESETKASSAEEKKIEKLAEFSITALHMDENGKIYIN